MTVRVNVIQAGGPARLRSLDGLRGLAASVVLVHHTALLIPQFAATYGNGTQLPAPGSLVWWMSYSPLKLFTAGGEAVILFFVLSGFVLTLPVLSRPGFDWVAYYPQRVTRLALPVLASIALAGILIVAVPQIPFQAADTWLSTYSTPAPAPAQFIAAADLFGHGSVAFHVNNPLWSLAWELSFSLALPVFVVLALTLRRWWPAAILVAFLLTAIGEYSASEPLDFLPTFFVGALIAARFDEVRAFIDRANQRRERHLIWLGITLAGALMLIAFWLAGPLHAGPGAGTPLLRALPPLGAALIVISALGWRPFERVLSSWLLQRAGKISFSLYLVHVPVLVFVAYLLHPASIGFAVIAGPVLAIVVAIGFFWLVESRCHRAARAIGQVASQRLARYWADREAKSSPRS